MSTKPILFSTPMVQAILDGRKTMTRRVIKPQPMIMANRKPLDGYNDNMIKAAGDFPTPKYHPGDVLWVRETWANISDWTTVDPELGVPDGYIYKANWEGAEHPKWRPSIFMPKEACRLFLRVTGARVERLQEITVDDCRNEGACCSDCYDVGEHSQSCKCDTRFRNLWDGLNAKRGYGWDTNPWVWVYTFERCEKPEGWCK